MVRLQDSRIHSKFGKFCGKTCDIRVGDIAKKGVVINFVGSNFVGRDCIVTKSRSIFWVCDWSDVEIGLSGDGTIPYWTI